MPEQPPSHAAPHLPPGVYVEYSPGGSAVWMVDEDGDWHEDTPRGVVDEDTPRAYYRVENSPTWSSRQEVPDAD